MEENINLDEKQEFGTIKISEEVVSTIAGLAATEVPGVAGMSGGVVNGLSEMLGRKNLSKGVKVVVGDKEASVDLFLIVDYGVRIPEVAWNVQESVKNSIETMTGLKVVEVNIHIQGVRMEKESDKKESAEDKN
ncbi:MAG: Asp23/Gls24 family envelope stress response protein [Thermoanaerobacteraceae bacterium]